eukprot:g15013.t1
MLISAVREVSLARRDLGWGVDAVAMRLTMLGILRHGRRKKPGVGQIPQEATEIRGGREWLDSRVPDWERFLRWAHASYGWTEAGVVKRAGFAPGELEVIALSRGKSRNRPMAPTYVLAVDHGRREIVLSVRGTKAFGDAITITHFRPEPFLDGYAHRGFAQSAHELVKQVEPQLTSLVERLPDYRVCFTGHSMGGGIAAMASMLIRDSAAGRHQQQQKRQKRQPSSTAPDAPASVGAATSPPPPSKPDNDTGRGEHGDDLGDRLRGLSGPGGQAASKAQAGERPGRRVGLGAEPMVYSFATPCCVSLELARGCKGWVDSIVHGDDAIPRLSTVSLELLKEDMTAAEWRRAVDRLANLNTVLSPSTNAAAAAAAAVKNALSGLGSLTRPEGPAGADADGGQGRRQTAASSNGADGGNRMSGSAGGGGGEFVSSREGWREEKKVSPAGGAEADGATAVRAAMAPPPAEAEPAARPAAEDAASAMGAGKGGGAQKGGSGEGEKEETDRKRDDLERSVRDTALTMRGLAKLYPLSQSFRQEIASIVSQVVKLTGGEKVDGAGAVIPLKPNTLNTADGGGQGHRSGAPHDGAVGGGDVSGGGVAAAAAAGAEREAQLSSRPELLLTLKENLESLGVNRAALQHDSSRGSRDSIDEGSQGSRMRQHGHSAADGADAARGAASGAEGYASRSLVAAAGGAAAGMATRREAESAEMKKEESTPQERTVTAATTRVEGNNPGCAGCEDDRLRFLHESYMARPEPSLLPLYPPGDSFLVRNHGSHGGANAARGGEMGGGGGDGGNRAPGEQGRAGTEQSTEAAAFFSATRSPSSSSPFFTSSPTSSVAAASAAATDAGPSSAEQAGGLADNTGGAVARSTRAIEGSGAWLVRVPHEYFLRMPLTPSMLEDHSIASYKRALAGLALGEKEPRRV